MNAYQKLAADLVNVRRLATARTHLRYSSLEDGSVPEYDRNGVLGSVWGTQWDGAHGILNLNGPTPPTPGGFEVRTVPGGLVVNWLGEWDPEEVAGQPVVAPSDFSRVEIHVSTDGTLSALLRETLKSYIETPRGAEVRIDLDYGAVVYVRAITRATTGKVSTASEIFGPFTIPKAVAADVDIDDIVGNKVHYGSGTPTAVHTGDLWLKWLNSPTLPAQYELQRWDGDSWEPLADQTAVAAALAASNAQAAADLKVRLYSQDAAPTGLTATDKAIWQDTNDGNKGYIWDGDSWEPRLIGNSAIAPASLVASTVLVTGSVSAALLEAIMVLATVIIAGNASGEHTRIDSTGVSNYAAVDGLPVELGRQGRGWSVRDPVTGDIVAATTDTGIGTFAALSVQDSDILIGGSTMAERDWERPWGLVGDAIYPATGGQSTNSTTELAFLEMAFTAIPGRSYELRTEPLEIAADGGDVGAYLRVRRTTDGSVPSTSSTLFREAAYRVRSTWPGRPSHSFLFDGPALGGAAQDWRFLLSYTAANGGTNARIWRGTDIRFWILDVGPSRENIGLEITGTGGVGGGGGTTPKVTKTVEYGPTWVRSWAQNNTTVIEDDLMYQGYGDSFNGNRRASAGFQSLTSLLSGATLHEMWIYMESWYWWNTSGGTLRLGYHGTLSEPATFPGHLDIVAVDFPARAYGKWIRVDGGPGALVNWRTALQSGAFRGISIGGLDNTPEYYGKFYGPARGRPRLKIKYTK